MAIFSREEPVGSPETIIGPSVKVEGNFSGSGDVVIEGALTGTLKTTKSVRVGSNAKVKADVEGASVYVAGEVRGNVKSAGAVELTSTARLIGNVETAQLRVESGAVLNGKCTMQAQPTEAPVPNAERKPRREPTVA
jgi:cytoskeletal protein CcmA (bactofilin family)